MSSPSDEIIRGNSSEVFKRLLSFIKPYKTASVLTLIALVLATAAELLMPIVMKRTLDDHLLRSERRLSLQFVKDTAEGRVEGILGKELADRLLNEGVTIGDSLFVSPRMLYDLDKKDISAGKDDGWLDKKDWYTLNNPDSTIRSVINLHPDLFIKNQTTESFAISISDRESLSPGEVKTLRSIDISGLKQRSLQYFLLLLVVLIFTFVQVYQASWIGQKIMADIRGKLLGHIMRQSLRYLGRTPVGSLVSRTANDVETIYEFFTNVTISFLKDGAIMAGVVIVIFALDKHLALVAMAALVPTVLLIVLFQKRVRESFRKVRAGLSAVNAYLSERLGGMSTVQLFAAEKRSRREFKDKNGTLLEAQLHQMKIMAVFRPLIDTISSLAVALVIWYSTSLHDQGLLTLGILIAFIELIQKFFHPVRDIAEKFNILQSAMAGGERIFDMLDTIDRIPDEGREAKDCTNEDLCGEIRFENVSFSYVPGEPVLNGLDFRIKPGETIAVVGATGAGKTTIANLLTRLWDPDAGSILLDGKDVRERPLEELRRTVQPVQQDVFLFAGTVAENIDLGIGLTEEKIINAAEISRADSFISKMPEAYLTQISEGAGNLSAGQRQLIAFARIIAHNPRVIILDEATANVDTQTETLLQEGLERLLDNRTAIVIAHRLSTIRRADRILVIGHGRVIEEGRHSELIARDGVYSRLYKLQSGNGFLNNDS